MNKYEIIVDVPMCAYNHEKFIAQTIEGVINQQADFKYKLIIGEDCSTDNTRVIIEKYLELYPDKLKVFFHNKNIGAVENSKILFANCNAKYIALCDGDDYWTDPNKLQKQVDFLEANSNYSICFHAVNTLSNGIEKRSTLNLSGKEETYSILDLAELNMIPTASVVFRSGLFENFPEWFNESPAGDYVLHLLNAKKGLIKYFPEVMAVYRVHDAGIWAQQDMSIIYPKWLWLLDKLQHEDFKEAVSNKLAAQKNRYFNEYIKLLLDRKQYDLIKETFYRFYKNDEAAGANILIDVLTKTISDLDIGITAIKNTKSYKTGKKLSDLKYKYSNLLTKK